MSVVPERWEHGSDFHWPVFPLASDSGSVGHPATFYGSGRDALRALLSRGRQAHNWHRFLVPDYFCQEVVASLLSLGLPIQTYADNPSCAGPNLDQARLSSGDAVLIVNYFGLRERPELGSLPSGVAVVEDHTHDPYSEWARLSTATYCLASLRKTLPVPGGGVLWSPQGMSLPLAPPPTSVCELGFLRRLVGMVLKDLYLGGHAVEKETFRQLLLAGEGDLAIGDISGMPCWANDLLRTLPIEDWRDRKRDNYRQFAALTAGCPSYVLLAPAPYSKACPFSLVLLFDTPDRRDQVRRYLIQKRVYPAILWSLEEPVVSDISSETEDFSRRMLSLHCDMRYGPQDIERLADLLRCAL